MLGFEGQESDRAGSDHVITPCGDGSYCCGSGLLASKCCKENRGLFVQNGTAVSRDSSSIAFDIVSSSSINATPSSSSIAALTLVQSSGALTPTASASSSPVAKPAHQTGVIVGAAIGGAAILGLITGIIVLIGMRRIKHKSPSQVTSEKNWRNKQDHEIYEAPTNNTSGGLAAVGPVSELGNSKESQRRVAELQNFEPYGPVPELQSLTRSHRR